MPKLELEIPEINIDELMDVMAVRLLNAHVSPAFPDLDDDEGDPGDPPERSASRLSRRGSVKIGLALRKYLDTKIDKLAKELVLEKFDQVIGERIAAAVDAVLAEGWTVTDGYGNVRGPKLDLKGRISEMLTAKRQDRYGNHKPSLIEEWIDAAVVGFLDRELSAELKAARQTLRDRLDKTIADKFTETIKGALGLR